MPTWPRLRRAASGWALGLLSLSAPARAIEPDAVPEALWWRAERPVSLAHEPLGVLMQPGGLGARVEWAPLYRTAGGSRVEQAARTVRLGATPGTWRWTAEIENRTAVLRGSAGPWRFATERLHAWRGAAGVLRRVGRVDLAAAAGAMEAGRPGAALAARAQLAPGWRTAWTWSHWPRRQRLDLGWDEVHLGGTGVWFEQRVRASLEGRHRGLEALFELSALDHRDGEARGADGVEPVLSWRAAELRLAGCGPLVRWAARMGHGAGHQGIRVWRAGGRQASAAGPVTNTQLEVEANGHRSPWRARLGAGEWRGDANGAVALGSFDPLAGVLASRRVAVSGAALRHLGGALDHVRAAYPGWEVGLAASYLKPRADYRTWQATLLGLGRDDLSYEDSDLRSAILVGMRVARLLRLGALRARVEAVQWMPVHVEGHAGTATGGDQGPAGGRPSGSTWGGTIARLSLEPTP